MKQFNRTSLPDQITYNGHTYKFLTGAGSLFKPSKIIEYVTNKGYKLIKINVLSNSLKGKTDLHGQPYKPSEFYFSFPEMTHEEKQKLTNYIREDHEKAKNNTRIN